MEKALIYIRKLFLPRYFSVRKMYDFGGTYLFYISRKENAGEEILDPWYTIDKKTMKIVGFVVHDHLEEFRKVIATTPVYTE